MITTKEKFIPEFLKWVKMKLDNALPEEDFEGSMLEQALYELDRHRGEVKNQKGFKQ